MIFLQEYEDNQGVCPQCDHHGRIGPEMRFANLFDDRQWEVLDAPEIPKDPLKFRDSKKYTERIKIAQNNTKQPDALVNAIGRMGGHKLIIGVQDFAFMGGSMGLAVGAAFVEAINNAVAQNCPYVIFSAAGGARMQEGIFSLMQLPKVTIAVDQLRQYPARIKILLRSLPGCTAVRRVITADRVETTQSGNSRQAEFVVYLKQESPGQDEELLP